MNQGKTNEAILWRSIALAYCEQEKIQVNSTMKAFYSALSRKNYEELRVFWLPSDAAELTIPGYRHAVSCFFCHSCILFDFTLISPDIMKLENFIIKWQKN